MLATRHYDTNHAPWPLETTHEASSRRPLSPRMSDPYAPSLSTQPGWHGDYSYPQHHEEVGFPHSFDRNHGISQLRNSEIDREPHSVARVKDEERSPHVQQLGRDIGQSPLVRDMSSGIVHQNQHHRGSLDSESLRESIHIGRNASGNIPGVNSEQDLHFRNREASLSAPDERFSILKEEDEEGIDDDEALDGDGDPLHPQTAAERTAARRKMKRFRYMAEISRIHS